MSAIEASFCCDGSYTIAIQSKKLIMKHREFGNFSEYERDNVGKILWLKLAGEDIGKGWQMRHVGFNNDADLPQLVFIFSSQATGSSV